MLKQFLNLVSFIFIFLLSQFLHWCDGVVSEECEGQARARLDYVQQLNSHRVECGALLTQLHQALHHLNHLHTQVTVQCSLKFVMEYLNSQV